MSELQTIWALALIIVLAVVVATVIGYLDGFRKGYFAAIEAVCRDGYGKFTRDGNGKYTLEPEPQLGNVIRSGWLHWISKDDTEVEDDYEIHDIEQCPSQPCPACIPVRIVHGHGAIDAALNQRGGGDHG